jgi:hypothetical protein
MHWAIAFALFSVICIVLAFRRHPIYGLYFYLATTYVHPPSRWWSTHLPDLRWAVLGAAVCVLAVLFHRGKLSQRPSWASSAPVIILCLYVSWMWVQMLWALDVDEHLSGSTTFTKYLLASWFVYRIADNKEAIRDVMFFHAAGCAMLGVIARYFEERTEGRIEGVGGPGIDDANSLGMFLCTGAVICLCLVVSQRGWRRWAALGMLAVTLVGFTMTESRGAFVGLVAGTLVLLFAHSRAYTKSMLGIGIVALLVGVAAVHRDQSFRDRLDTMGDVAADTEDKEADGSARARREKMRNSGWRRTTHSARAIAARLSWLHGIWITSGSYPGAPIRAPVAPRTTPSCQPWSSKGCLGLLCSWPWWAGCWPRSGVCAVWAGATTIRSW